jgi:hypothetical protein
MRKTKKKEKARKKERKKKETKNLVWKENIFQHSFMLIL